MYRHPESKLFSDFFRFHVEPPVLANRDYGTFPGELDQETEQAGSKPQDKMKSLLNFFHSRSTFRAFPPDLSHSYCWLEVLSRIGVFLFAHNPPSFLTKITQRVSLSSSFYSYCCRLSVPSFGWSSVIVGRVQSCPTTTKQ